MNSLNSGTTAVATNGTAAATLILVANPVTVNGISVVNEGSVAGFFSVDNGASWRRLPAQGSRTLPVHNAQLYISGNILIKRDPSASSDMSGVYADCW